MWARGEDDEIVLVYLSTGSEIPASMNVMWWPECFDRRPVFLAAKADEVDDPSSNIHVRYPGLPTSAPNMPTP